MSSKQQPPVDLNSLSSEERQLYEKYGRLPNARKDLVSHKLKERKYFDSGDYALYKAGKQPSSALGHQHPSPDSIPHSHPTTTTTSVNTHSHLMEGGTTRADLLQQQQQQPSQPASSAPETSK